MGTVIPFPEKSSFADTLMQVNQIEALKAPLAMQSLQIAVAARRCSTLSESTDVLIRSLGQLHWLVEMVEDDEVREELRTTLKSASAKLENSLKTLANARQIITMAGKQ